MNDTNQCSHHSINICDICDMPDVCISKEYYGPIKITTALHKLILQWAGQRNSSWPISYRYKRGIQKKELVLRLKMQMLRRVNNCVWDNTQKSLSSLLIWEGPEIPLTTSPAVMISGRLIKMHLSGISAKQTTLEVLTSLQHYWT